MATAWSKNMQTSSGSIAEDLTVEEAFSRVLQGNLAGVKKMGPSGTRW